MKMLGRNFHVPMNMKVCGKRTFMWSVRPAALHRIAALSPEFCSGTSQAAASGNAAKQRRTNPIGRYGPVADQTKGGL